MSWRSFSGRQTGADSYQFGDLSRSVFRMVVGASQPASDNYGIRTSWRESAGRIAGSEGYTFGDFTRSIVRAVLDSDSSDPSSSNEGAGAADSNCRLPKSDWMEVPVVFRTYRELVGLDENVGSIQMIRVRRNPVHVAKNQVVSICDVWLGFFNSCYYVGQDAVSQVLFLSHLFLCTRSCACVCVLFVFLVFCVVLLVLLFFILCLRLSVCFAKCACFFGRFS